MNYTLICKTPDDAISAFDEYLKFVGFPIIGISNFDTISAYQVVEGIYAAVITRDISKRHKIRNKELFDRVVHFIIENAGTTFSANSIVKFLKNEHRSISVETIYYYRKWLAVAFIVNPYDRVYYRAEKPISTLTRTVLRLLLPSDMANNTQTLHMKAENRSIPFGKERFVVFGTECKSPMIFGILMTVHPQIRQEPDQDASVPI